MISDWRLTNQETYLSNVELKKISKYKKHSETWEHEHCDFCTEKISEYDGDLHAAYCTLDEKNWICEQCYNDFKEMFNWKVIK